MNLTTKKLSKPLNLRHQRNTTIQHSSYFDDHLPSFSCRPCHEVTGETNILQHTFAKYLVFKKKMCSFTF